MAAVLKQIEATHLKRREEISERMQHKPRFCRNASQESSTNVSEGSSTPCSPPTSPSFANRSAPTSPSFANRSSNFSSPFSSAQHSASWGSFYLGSSPSKSAQSLSTRMKERMNGQLETIDKEQQASAAASRKVENEGLQRRLETSRTLCRKAGWTSVVAKAG